MPKQKLIIDVDQVIESYNEKNPEKRPMTRTELAKKVGVNKQVFSDWKGGKTPKWAYILIELMDIGSCGVGRFINESNGKR